MFKDICTPKNVSFGILTLALLFFIPKISAILLLFFAGFVLACALNPYVEKLQDKLGRTAASASVMGMFSLAVIALFLPIFFVTYEEIRIFAKFLPNKLSQLDYYIGTTQVFGVKLADYLDMDHIVQSSTGMAQKLLSHSVDFTLGIVEVVIIIVAVTMILYYFLADKSYLRKKFLEFFPDNLKEKADNILVTISSRVGGYVRAQVLSMAVVGFMVALALLFMGIDYPILLGLITGVLEIIPVLGPTIAVCLIMLVAYPLTIGKFFGIIAMFLIIQQLANYILRPILFGKFMSLHPLMIFFALFVAQKFLGFLGVILAPALAATFCVLINELYICEINKCNNG